MFFFEYAPKLRQQVRPQHFHEGRHRDVPKRAFSLVEIGQRPHHAAVVVGQHHVPGSAFGAGIEVPRLRKHRHIGRGAAKIAVLIRSRHQR